MDQLPKSLTIPIGRLGAAAQNALEMARFGGLTTDEEPSRYEVVSEQRVYRLRHYLAGEEPSGPPVLLVPPMMLAAEVYDVSPSTSASRSSRGTGSIPGWSTLARPSVRRGASSAR